MKAFLFGQMDYIFFIYGLSFIFLSTTSCFLWMLRPKQDFWKWIALFGLLHGIVEWCDMIALSLGNLMWFKILRIILLTASFLCFVALVREEAAKKRPGLFGAWIYGPIVILTFGVGWSLDRWTGVNIFSRYILGGFGGLCAAFTLLRLQNEDIVVARAWRAFAVLLAGYACTQFIVPKSVLAPAVWVNQDVFFTFTHIPIQLVRILFALALVMAAWRIYYIEMAHQFPKTEKMNRFENDWWFPVCIGLIVCLGFFGTIIMGENETEEQRGDVLRVAQVAAAGIRPARIEAMTGTPADEVTENYARIVEHLLAIQRNLPEARFAYLLGKKDGRIIFLVDAELEKSEAGAAHTGDLYEEDISLLQKMFVDGRAKTIGPTTGKWGALVSGYAPVRGADGRVLGLVGIDRVADLWAQSIERQRLYVILLTLLFVILIMVFFLIRRREYESRRIIQENERKYRAG